MYINVFVQYFRVNAYAAVVVCKLLVQQLSKFSHLPLHLHEIVDAAAAGDEKELQLNFQNQNK